MANTAPLSLGLDDPSDDECDKQLNATMQGLVDGELDAATAAKRIDTLIIDDCEKGYATRSKPAVNRKDDAGEDEDGEKVGTPSGWVPYLWRTVGKVAIAVPPRHAGQTRLVEFIQELFRLRQHTVEYITPYGDVLKYTLWEDARSDDRFCQEMRLLDTEANPRKIAAYLNFSAFLARVFAGGAVDTTRFCGLITDEFLGLYWPYNKQTDRSEPYILAGAEWMMHAAAAMWEMCDRKAYAAKGFNAGWWARWEARFKRVNADDSGFSQQARDAAAGALEQMEMAKEGRLAGLSVVGAFGLKVKDWEDDE